MQEEKKKKQPTKGKKERADKYEEKVSFDGTFDELLDLTLKPKSKSQEKEEK